MNDEQFDRVADKVVAHGRRRRRRRTVAVWGLTFKARTDDLRESPRSRSCADSLAAGAKVRRYDPAVSGPARSSRELEVVADPYAACEGADVLAVLTEWDEFKWLDLDKVAAAMATPRDRRRPQPARPRRRAAPRVHVPGHRPQLMARVVVTGGAGFLGSHLADALLDRGDEVVAVDNLVTGSAAQHRSTSLDHAGFTFVEARRDRAHLGGRRGRRRAALRQPGVAARLPRAARSRPSRSAAIGTHNALGLARAKGARFLLASTCEVYGDPLVHPQPETYWGNVNPIGPRSVYDEAKRFAEALTMAYHRIHGVDVRIVRIFNTYGPRMRARRRPGGDQLHHAGAARRAPHRLRRRQPDPQLLLRRRRGRGFLALLDGDITGPINIGNAGEFTMLELAEVVLEVTGSSSPIEHRAAPGRRPQAAPARPHPGPQPARLGAHHRAARGRHPHHRVLPRAARRRRDLTT